VKIRSNPCKSPGGCPRIHFNYKLLMINYKWKLRPADACLTASGGGPFHFYFIIYHLSFIISYSRTPGRLHAMGGLTNRGILDITIH